MKNSSQISTKIGEQGNKSFVEMKMTSSNTFRQKLQDSRLTPIQNKNEAQFIFDLSVTTSRILQSFAQVGMKLGFNLIEEQSNYATIIKQRKKKFMDIFSCINFNTDQSYDYTAIKIMIKMNEINATKVCRIRGLVGSSIEVCNFLSEFKKKAIQIKNNKYVEYQQDIQQAAQQPSNPFHIEVCADYAFYKILSLQSYGLGKNLSNSINDFKSSFKNVEQSADLLPLPMKNLFNLIGQVVQNLYKQFNSGRKQMEKVMPYCRISVEKYVCQKLNLTIFPIYQYKNKEFEIQYRKKRQQILKEKTILQIFADTCLYRKFWLVKQQPDAYKSPITLDRFLQNRQTIKFIKGVQQLEKIKNTTNIREKLKYCQLMYTKVKSLVFDFYAGKQQLSNMEDILPIIIIIVLISDIPDLKSQIEMMMDFISFDPCDQQSQKRLLINLNESCNYIKRDWKI